ncbi:MAG TPA: protein kinase [Burkholderiaceae bacterium]|jgi:serine/threonine-protein kinase|nr:protein kinase [Burkholderiaceae bacterium]
MNGEQIGNFRLISRIGEGGMGEVFHAMDTMLEREVALKTLRPELSAREELVERFRVEAIALAKLHHPNIAAVYSFFREDLRYHMAMQFVHGQTLEQCLAERIRLDWHQAAQIAVDVLQALEHAHALGVVHRDLKPANLMIDPRGRTVVMDFGIARVLARARQTRAGNLVGTMEYIAPENIRGEDPGPRADFYSLGIVLFELVTGRLPFAADNDYALMRAHTELAPPPPSSLCPSLPQPFEEVILRALAKRPADRFADAREFLHAVCQATGIDEPHAGAIRAAPASRSRRAWPLKWRSLVASAGRWREHLEIPARGGLSAWIDWSKANPGLAMAAAAGVVATGFVVAGLSSQPGRSLEPTSLPPVLLPAHEGAGNLDASGVVAAARDPNKAGMASPAVSEAKTGPSDARDVVMPPEPKANVVIDRPVPEPVQPAATPVARPAPRNPDPGSGGNGGGSGWYIKR